MAQYDVVVWFAGGDGRPGPYPGDQAELASYLEDGGSLLLTSMQYFHGQEANDFSFTYLGIEDHTRSTQSAKITGVAGHPVGGEFQETMQLVYPYGSFSGTAYPADHAEVAFTGDKAAPGIALTVDGRIYRTSFNFFPWETIFGLENRLQVMAKYLDWLTDKDTGTIQGTVTDAETGEPVADGTVFITDRLDGKVYEAVTDADGFYSRELPAGTFDAVFTGYGYEDGAAADITIGIGATTTVNAELEHAPRVTISGVVADGDTGEGLEGSVYILNAPLPPVETDPATGEYEIEVPVGNYTLEARVKGYLPLQRTADAGADVTVNFDLEEFAVSVLLVHDQNEESFDGLPIYEEALQTLNIDYEHYLVPRGGSGPPLATLMKWDVVVWFSGGTFLWAGPNDSDEAALTEYLEAGGSLLLSSQGYIGSRGVNPFTGGYLGVESYSSSSRSVEVTGVEGHPVGGQFPDPLDLVFPAGFTNRSDTIRPGTGARVAFTGDRAADGIALTFDGGVYKTAFLAFPWELIDDPDSRNAIMLEFLDWLRTKPVGDISGRVTDAGTGEGVAGAAVTISSDDGAVFEDVTDEQGYYGRTVPVGTFDVAFTLYGYEDHVIPGVVVGEGDDVKVDVGLEKSPTAIISGTVSSSETGEGLAATISVLDAPVAPVETDPATGEYEVEVVLGEYTVEARAEGHLPGQAPADASADVTMDFQLEPFDVTVLLVEDQGFSSRDTLPIYEEVLNGLNVTYEVFPVPYGSRGPRADEMAGWDVVVWFTGDESYGVGPGGTDEAELAEYLQGGGSVFMSSQGYLATAGTNDFNGEYLGVGDYEPWTFSYIVSGVEGHPVTGNYTDPMELDFSMYIETGTVTAAPHAETAFTGDRAPEGIAVTVDRGLYKTAFLGFPWEGITDEESRRGIMTDFLKWLTDRSGLGTVEGIVTDYNDGEGIAGAKVRAIVGEETVYEAATGADGRYQLMLPLGEYTVEASGEHYGPESREIELEDEGEETEADFVLKTGAARAEPDALEFEVIEGNAADKTFTLSNEGSRGMGWNIETEYRMRPHPTAGTETLHLARNPHYDVLAPTTAGMYADAEPEYAPAAAGDVLKSWPSGLSLPWGVGFDGDVIISNPAGGGGDDHDHKFTVDGEFITKWSTAAWHGQWAADIAYDVNNDLLWQVAVGGDNCLYGLKPDTGAQVEKICGSPWAGEAQRGVAYRADDDTFYVAGWVENIIYHIAGLSHDNPGEVISQRSYSPGGRGLSGLTWNGDAGVLWVATNSPDDNMYALEPDNGWLEVALLGHPDPGNNGGGLSMDEEGNLWMVSQRSRMVYLVDSGIEAIAPPPWLTAHPGEGRLDPDEGETITVSVDTDGMRLGTYSGSVIVNSESGRRPFFEVPVTLTVLMGDHGRVKGRVTDLNDKDPVAGAAVRALVDGNVVERTFTDDDGVYELQLRLGEYTIEAEAKNYRAASETVNIAEHGEEHTVHLALATAVGKADPEALEFSLEEGDSETKTVTIINTGTADMTWSISKRRVRPGGFGSSDLSIHPAGLVKNPSFDADAATAQGMYGNGSLAAIPAARGDVLKSWPINLAEPWGVGFDGDVIFSNPATGAGGDNHNHKFTEDGEFVTKWSTADWQGTWTADMAYDDRHDLVWQVNVGGDNCIHGMDPVKGALMGTICGAPWSNVSQRGLAYRSDDDTFYVGGWNENIIYRIAGLTHLVPGSVIEAYEDFSYGGISGLAWNDTAKVLWVASNSADDNMYAFAPDEGWDQVAVVGHPEGGGFNAAGLSINDDGHLWLISQDSNTAYLVDGGIPHSGGLSWLKLDPVKGVVPAGQSVTVEVGVNAAGVEPGVHQAALLIATDSGRQQELLVEVTAEIIMGPSATVKGLVTDANDGEPVSGARVEAADADGNLVSSVKTGSDGGYELELRLGEYTVAASAINYAGESVSVDLVTEGAVYEEDFGLATGRGEAAPAELEFTVSPGGSATGSITLSNTGGGDLTWHARGFSAGAGDPIGSDPDHVPFETAVRSGSDMAAPSSRGIYVQTPVTAPAPRGEVLKSWPTDLAGPWGVGYDGHVIISNLSISGGDYKYTVDGEQVTWWPTSSWHDSWAADMAFDSNHGLLWQVNVGGDNCIYGLDPADGEQLESICGSAWTGTSQRGLAYRADNDTLYVGGWNQNIIYNIKGLSHDNPGEVIEQLAFSPGGRGISGLAWNDAARVLWVATNSADDNLYALAPDEGWQVIAEIGHPEGGEFNGAGLSIDEAGNLWMVSQNSKLAYLVDGGIPGWLEADPHGGVIGGGSSETVDVKVDSSGLEPGTYEAVLRISTDGGREPRNLTVGVKLHVLDPDAGPHLVVTEPEDDTHTNEDFITVAGTALDPAGGPVTVTVNGQNAPVGDDGGFTFVELLPEEEGPYEITVVATDADGESATDVRTVIVDRTDPVIDAGSIQPAEDVELAPGETVIIGFTGERGLAAGYTVLIAGGLSNGVPGTPIEEIDDGVYEAVYTAPADAQFENAAIEINAADKAGNMITVQAPGRLSVVPGHTPPTVVITEPEEGFLTNRDAVRVSGTATDEQGITGVTIDGRAVEVGDDGGFSGRALLLVEGPNVIHVTATNAAGLETTETVTVIADWTDPVLENIMPGEDVLLEWGEELEISFTSEPDLTVAYQMIVSGAFSEGGTILVRGVPFDELDPGVYKAVYTAPAASFSGAEIQINAKDAAGNKIHMVAPGRVTVVPPAADPVGPPELVITEPADGFLTNRTAVTVSGTATDDQPGQTVEEVTVNGRTVAVGDDGGFTMRLVLTEGDNLITVTATNTAGETTTETVTVTADWTPPELSNMEPAEPVTLTAGQSYTVRFTSEPGLTAAYQVIIGGQRGKWHGRDIPVRGVAMVEVEDGVYEATYTAPAGTAFAEGIVQFNAADAAGNVTMVTAPGSITVVKQ